MQSWDREDFVQLAEISLHQMLMVWKQFFRINVYEMMHITECLEVFCLNESVKMFEVLA